MCNVTEKKICFSGREQALIKRGYPVSVVEKYSYSIMNYADKTAEQIIHEYEDTCKNVISEPICILLGGQPGSGKSVYSRKYIRTREEAYCIIGIDDYRCFHPYYEEIEVVIRRHWADRAEGINDTPGNDMADFTHRFAGIVTDLVIEKCRKNRWNMIIEWGLRMPEEPLRMMQQLKQDGYTIHVKYIAVHKSISYEACRLRADIMNQKGHIMRRVSHEFHELAVSALPASCKVLYEGSVIEHSCCDDFRIIDRQGKTLWKKGDMGLVSDIYEDYLQNRREDLENEPREAYSSVDREMRGLKEKISN